MKLAKHYFDDLKKRAKESRVYRDYQLIGLELSEILEDPSHRSLYIKLAKEGDPHKLVRLAKTIADKKGVKNRGAYFMKMLKTNDI